MDSSLLEEYNPLAGPTEQLNALTDQFIGVITIVTIASIVLGVVVITLWIIGWVQKMKMHRAILDIQKTLAEMNEREKQRENMHHSEAIAQTSPTSETN